MGYRNLQECVADLEKNGKLIRITTPLDPYLEIGAVQRRVYRNGGPALLFTNPQGTNFPMLGNLFGTIDRTRFIFRDTLDDIKSLVKAKVDPGRFLKSPVDLLRSPFAAINLLPMKTGHAPVLECRTKISNLPGLVSWPMDGGPFITLPQVYTESPAASGFAKSNIGMYRVQLAGNDYKRDEEIGLHYQIHRGIANHHAEAIARGDLLRVNVFVGGPPAMTVAAVMPLPEGMPELSFAGLLGGHRIRVADIPGHIPVSAEADFCICGTIDPSETRLEGPFGDHIGYYSLAHHFPFIKVDAVYHRKDAIWPFTTVGRPPQEDTSFGEFIHELTGELIPTVIHGVKEVHAVDAAGVHPLLLAIASERYTPYLTERAPQELLTIANAILGQGQLSLAKYLFIAAAEDAPHLTTHNPKDFIVHVLERCDWSRDLHFQASTTIDTLDYTGGGLNQGSKVVIAAAGEKKYRLSTELSSGLTMPDAFKSPRIALPGVMAVTAPPSVQNRGESDQQIEAFCNILAEKCALDGIRLILLCDDSEFVARNIDNFLWVTFTRSNPATDIYGVRSFSRGKQWGCEGPLVIDARIKPFHAPLLEDDPAVEKMIDELGRKGGELHGVI